MIRFLLQEIEKSINPTFTKRELLSISPEHFADLINRKILYFRPADSDMEMLRFPRCPHGCPLTVVRAGDILEAVCPEHPEEDPIPVEKDDLSRYAFSVDKFLSELRSANSIEGKLKRIKGGYFYVGYKTYNSNRVGFVFVPRIGDGELIALSGLRHLCRDDNVLVILTPTSTGEDLTLKEILRHNRIIHTPLISALDPHTFKLPVERLIAGLLRPGAEISERQRKDYDKFDYRCHDKLYIPGTTPMKRSNLIVVNEDEVRIGDSLFLLLMRFVVELKKGEGGWASNPDLLPKMADSSVYQVYSRLRTEMKGSLQDKDGQKFIESNGSGSYRISTHPDFVTYDKEKLQNHPDHRISKLAEKLP